MTSHLELETFPDSAANEWHTLELRTENAAPEVEAVFASLTGSEPREQLRHYLDGQPIRAGDVLELWRAGGWQSVRYEWTFRRVDPVTLIVDNDAPPLELEAETTEVALRWITPERVL